MNLLNLIEDTTAGYDNLRALMQASQSGQDAVLNIGGETVTLDPMETRWIFAKYKAFNKAGRQEEFLNHLADPVKFDQHMKQLRQLIDKQKNFRGSVPGQRGVDENLVAGIVGHEIEKFLDEPNPSTGVAEETVEEIAMSNPERPTQQTAGKINWERMIKDYMGNKPYTEFEFGADRPLTLYRSQVYAILKDFGRMKPQQKVGIILNTFGDKTAMVDYIDKLRAKGMMPKKVPAYVAPGTEPVPPGQMSFPGMDSPKIREAEAQKKNSEITELDRKAIVNPRVARAFQLARARQTAAGSDIEAFVQDELEKQTQTDQTIKDLEAVNRRQDAALKKAQALDIQQGNDISDIEAQLGQVAQKLQIVKTAKPAIGQSSSTQAAATPTAPVVQQPAATEPQAPAAPTDIQQQPTDVAEPTVAKKKPAPRKKSGATKVSKPRKASKPAEVPVPDNVLAFPQGGRRGRSEPAVAQDELSAALQGVDIGEPGTGTYGLREATNELHIGDPVIIGGNVEHAGKTGDVAGFGRDKHFVIVDLYNFGKHAFHASNVQYNDYADQEVDEAETHDKTGAKMHQAQEKFLLRHNGKDIAFFNTAEVAKQAAQDLMRELKGLATVQRVMRENQRMDKFNIAQPTPGGSNKQREEFLNARDRLFRQMANASPGEKEAIRLKIAELEGQAQSQGIRIRETDDLNRSGYNAIKSVSDWEEKMRVMQELMKDRMLMSDPEAKAAIQQRIGDLIRVGQQQGYLKEALNDKAMSVLRSLQQPAQPAPAAVDLNTPAGPRRGRPSNAQRAQRHEEFLSLRRHIALLDELIQMKEQIDRLFLKAQNVRGGIYPGLQADIEMEELYPVPETDRQFQDLKDKYTKDLAALQKFLAMKKAVYREGQDCVSESTALIRLKQARQALSQQSVTEVEGDDIWGPQGNFAGDTPVNIGGATMKTIQVGDVVKYFGEKARVVELSPANNYARITANGKTLNVRLSDLRSLGQGLKEFAPAGRDPWGDDDRGEDPYGRPQPKHYNRSIDFFGQFEADHFDREDFDDATGVFKGYWGDDQIAYFKFDNPQRNGSDDPGMGWYYEPQNESVAEGHADQQRRVFKKNGKPVGEIGIDPESSPGNGPWYVHHYATGYSVVGFDSAAEAKRELMYVHKHPDAVEGHPSTKEQGVAEAQTDYQRRRQRERDVDAGKPVSRQPKNPQTDYAKKRAKDRRDMELGEDQLDEKQDACYHKVKSRYKVWPSAYASGALVQCRKKGADNWGTGGKKK